MRTRRFLALAVLSVTTALAASCSSSEDAPVPGDGGACTRYQRPGCGASTPAPSCATNVEDAIALRACTCRGTIVGGSDSFQEPWARFASEAEVAAGKCDPNGPPLATVPNDAAGGDASPDANAPDVSFPDPLSNVGSVQSVKAGYGFTEGPLWRAATQDLIFSDISNDTIERYAPPSTFTTFRDPSGRSNGLAFDPQGRLIACEGGNRRVSRTLANMNVETVIDQWQGKKLNAPNDVIVRSDGTLYFTDPDYSVNGTKELTFNGVYRVEPNGTAHLVADDLAKPNGIALSPDEKTLYVADESTGFIRRYDVAQDGSTSNPKKLVDVSHPDGMTVDDAGNLYVAAQTAIEVFRPDGTPRGSLPVAKRPTNCAFGGTDRKTLFITAQDTLYKIDLKVPGPP